MSKLIVSDQFEASFKTINLQTRAEFALQTVELSRYTWRSAISCTAPLIVVGTGLTSSSPVDHPSPTDQEN